MAKKIVITLGLFAVTFGLFAYNPPAGGENLFRISSPFQLVSASSAAGGAFFDVTPASQVFNPALQAFEQRVMLDAGFTALFSSSDDDSGHSFGSAFQGGLLVPTKWGVGSAEVIADFVPFDDMQIGKSVNIKLSAAKDVTDRLAVGAGIGCGFFTGYDTDWSAGLDTGVLYRWGTLGPLEDVRFGISLLNIGKTYDSTTVIGIKESSNSGAFPGVATLRTGMAATFLKSGFFTGAFSADVAFPSFQNFVLDTGIQFLYRNFLTLSTSWEYNAREWMNGEESLLPAVGITFRFLFNSKGSTFMKEKGWQQSEMAVAAAWQHMYDTVNAFSGGATLKLGLKDTEAPVISLWDTKKGEK